jgi:exonuclease SbcC
MKFRKLNLKAIGPFTDVELDFSGPANLHVVYGPNEAGKSSALRAMGDLRYGIPGQSSDNFVHDFKAMLIAGTFEDAAGHLHVLARRKGNKDTLMRVDPLTGAALQGPHVTPDVVLALTGGVERRQFETMYGLNSEHLREGGLQLINGSGELGAALFEASTGSAGIKLLQASLQDKAKTYFAPRSQTAQLNEAVKQLDAARQRHKQAVTKPDQWKVLKRAHEDAQARLSDIRQQLARLRRRDTELAGLRAVEPLLRHLDRAEAVWAEVEAFEALPENAREIRLAAQQHVRQAELVQREAHENLAAYQLSLNSLKIDKALLDHGTAIDRLMTNVAMVRRDRDQRISLSETAQAEAQQLSLDAMRLVTPGSPQPNLDALYTQVISAADQSNLMREIEEWRLLGRDLAVVQAQAEAALRKIKQWESEQLTEPSLHMQLALSEALALAQGLGDVDKRIAAITTERDAEKRKLDRHLADLNVLTADDLKSNRWLAVADIEAHESDRAAVTSKIVLNLAEEERTNSDLAEQSLRLQMLAATGEVVTAETVVAARNTRDQGWLAIRAEFIDHTPHEGHEALRPDAKAILPVAFENAKTEADRQADLLSAGAQRAAEVAECKQRISAMEGALEGLKKARVELEGQVSSKDQVWHLKLTHLGLPHMSAAAARDWVALRQTAFDCLDRVTGRVQELAQLNVQVRSAMDKLSGAVTALGLVPRSVSEGVAGLLAQAKTIDQELVLARTAIEHRTSDMAEQKQGLLDAEGKLRELNERMKAVRVAMDTACARLHLAAGAAPELIKAKSLALQGWADEYRQHFGNLRQLRQLKANEAAMLDEAGAVGRTLGEDPPSNLDTWLDTLARRLAVTRDAIQKSESLQTRMEEEGGRQNRAVADLAAATRTLNALVLQAKVASVEHLPDAEDRSKQRRDAATSLKQQRDQLASASEKDIPSLRAILADQDTVALDAEKQSCADNISNLETREHEAIAAEHAAKLKLDEVDTSDEAAQAREEMESAIARYRAGVRPWAQLKLAEALLSEALRRHREKAQGPVVALASEYFKVMTGGRFARLLVDADDDKPVLLAQPAEGKAVPISALSEGTADQLYLALRLAALEVQRSPDRVMPLVLDDVFMTSDDERAANMFIALEKFAAQCQVLVFTHHRHLIQIAERSVQPNLLRTHELISGVENHHKE